MCIPVFLFWKGVKNTFKYNLYIVNLNNTYVRIIILTVI